MDFALSPAQRELRREMASLGAELDRAAAPGSGSGNGAGAFPRALWRRLGAAQVPGLAVSAAYGGRGLGALDTAVALAGLGRGCGDAGLLFSLGAHLLACAVPLERFGSAAQKERYLPGLATGERIGGLAMTEPGAGSDSAALRTRAERHGDGFCLTGEKALITNAPVADLLLVGARTGAAGEEGVSVFLVETAAPGVERSPPLATLGLTSSPLGSVAFDGVRLPPSALLGRLGNGALLFQTAMEWERTCLFAAHLGTLERLLDLGVAEVRARRRQGRDVQAAAHRLADLKVALEAGRLLVYRAAWQLDRGRSAVLEAALAKLYVSEELTKAAAAALTLAAAGGADSAALRVEAERAVRDAAAATLYSGTSEIQRNLIAALLGA